MILASMLIATNGDPEQDALRPDTAGDGHEQASRSACHIAIHYGLKQHAAYLACNRQCHPLFRPSRTQSTHCSSTPRLFSLESASLFTDSTPYNPQHRLQNHTDLVESIDHTDPIYQNFTSLMPALTQNTADAGGQVEEANALRVMAFKARNAELRDAELARGVKALDLVVDQDVEMRDADADVVQQQQNVKQEGDTWSWRGLWGLVGSAGKGVAK